MITSPQTKHKKQQVDVVLKANQLNQLKLVQNLAQLKQTSLLASWKLIQNVQMKGLSELYGLVWQLKLTVMNNNAKMLAEIKTYFS